MFKILVLFKQRAASVASFLEMGMSGLVEILENRTSRNIVTNEKGYYEMDPAVARKVLQLAKSLESQLQAYKEMCEVLEGACVQYANKDHFHGEDWDTVSGEPANILFWHEEPLYIEDGSTAKQALQKVAEIKRGLE